jgi:predicted transcriptional regulator
LGMGKDRQMNARVTEEVKDAFDRAAEAEDRTVSYLLGKVVEEWLVREGWLKTDKPPPKRRSK